MDFHEYVYARGPALMRLACLLTGDPHRAEDLVQEVLVSLSLTTFGGATESEVLMAGQAVRFARDPSAPAQWLPANPG